MCTSRFLQITRLKRLGLLPGDDGHRQGNSSSCPQGAPRPQAGQTAAAALGGHHGFGSTRALQPHNHLGTSVIKACTLEMRQWTPSVLGGDSSPELGQSRDVQAHPPQSL